MKFSVIYVFMAFALVSCSNKESEGTSYASKQGKKAFLKYAENFSITEYPKYKTIEVTSPWRNSRQSFKYLLISKNSVLDTNIEGHIKVKTPILKIVSLSSVYLPFIDSLGGIEYVSGIDEAKHINNPKIRKKINKGIMAEVSQNGKVNMEVLLNLKPDGVFTFAIGKSENDDHHRLLQKNIPVIMTAGYMEEHPLGRAEWIKFIGAFLEKDPLADSIFSRVDSSYRALCALTDNLPNKPRVFAGSMYGGVWHVPGGKSFTARFFKDAGADYLWKNNTERGGVPLSFESVLSKAQNADFWLNTTSWSSKKEIESSDSRYTFFKAYQNSRIYNHNKRINPWGGSDYFETGSANPQLILKDLITLFHPGLLSDSSLFFYHRLL